MVPRPIFNVRFDSSAGRTGALIGKRRRLLVGQINTTTSKSTYKGSEDEKSIQEHRLSCCIARWLCGGGTTSALHGHTRADDSGYGQSICPGRETHGDHRHCTTA